MCISSDALRINVAGNIWSWLWYTRSHWGYRRSEPHNQAHMQSCPKCQAALCISKVSVDWAFWCWGAEMDRQKRKGWNINPRLCQQLWWSAKGYGWTREVGLCRRETMRNTSHTQVAKKQDLGCTIPHTMQALTWVEQRVHVIQRWQHAWVLVCQHTWRNFTTDPSRCVQTAIWSIWWAIQHRSAAGTHNIFQSMWLTHCSTMYCYSVHGSPIIVSGIHKVRWGFSMLAMAASSICHFPFTYV